MHSERVGKENDLCLVGPFWIISKSLRDLNKGYFWILCKTFLVDWEGNHVQRVPKSQLTHKSIWENELQSSKPYNYYPRGRVSINEGNITVNIPEGLNEELVIREVAKKYGFDYTAASVRYIDPASGNHYDFLLR